MTPEEGLTMMKTERLAWNQVDKTQIQLNRLVEEYLLVCHTEGKSPYNYGIWDLNCNQLIPMGYEDESGFGGGPISGMLVKVYKV